MGGLNFGERFYQALANDPTYSQLIKKVELPSDSQLTKSKVSSTVGYIVGKTIGIGWRSVVHTNIHFKNCPIIMARIFKDKNGSFTTSFFSPLITSKNYTRTSCWIQPSKTEGRFIVKKVLGMRVSPKANERNCPGSDAIEKDEKLLTDILEVVRDARGFDCSIHLDVKDAGGLQVCETQWDCLNDKEIQPQEITKAFSCVLRIAEHVQENL